MKEIPPSKQLVEKSTSLELGPSSVLVKKHFEVASKEEGVINERSKMWDLMELISVPVGKLKEVQ